MRGPPWKSLLLIALLALAWFGLALLVGSSYYQLMLTLVPIWAVLGLSWNISSAYTVTIALVRFDLTPWFGIPLGMAVGALAGAVIGFPTFRLRGHYFALAM